MFIGKHNLNDDVLIVAEIGNNHEGDFGLAKDMISAASESGANAVKFQTIIPNGLVSPLLTNRIEQLSRYSFSQDQYFELYEFCNKNNISFLSTPFCFESFNWLIDIIPAIKISSGDNNFYPLLKLAARKGKPIILSTGLADLTQIRNSCRIIEDEMILVGNHADIILLHCVSAYPTPTEQANLKAISTLSKNFPYLIGYSDHTLGIDAALLSVALGARLIEKHFTLSKSQSSFRDHQLSADPSDLKELVCKVRKAEKLLGNGEKIIQDEEINISISMRRSIVARKTLPINHTISKDDLTFLRPGGGLNPGQESLLIGKTLNKEILLGEKITEDLVR